MAAQHTLSIGELGRRTGQRASALRYYEDIGLLRPSHRVGGKRRYDQDSLRRLAIIGVCQDAGFTLAEISHLINGGAPQQERFRELADRKLAELESRIQHARAAQHLLQDAMRCPCVSLEECDLINARMERRLLG